MLSTPRLINRSTTLRLINPPLACLRFKPGEMVRLASGVAFRSRHPCYRRLGWTKPRRPPTLNVTVGHATG
jgi:hypothetical protein